MSLASCLWGGLSRKVLFTCAGFAAGDQARTVLREVKSARRDMFQQGETNVWPAAYWFDPNGEYILTSRILFRCCTRPSKLEMYLHEAQTQSAS